MVNWNDKVVIVAGGSSGLGLAVAQAFLRRGARVRLLARNAQRLNNVVAELNKSNDDRASGNSVDATNEQDVLAVASQIATDYGRIDVWVNAIGQSIRTSFSEADGADYRRLMDQNFFATLHCSLAALPQLEKSSGSLVNIGSLASKTAWPLVAPYVASKHALTGFCDQLRLEGPPSVHILHVCPGPITRADNDSRYSEQMSNLPESAHRPGAGAPVKTIDPDWLAEKIIRACENRKSELVVPGKSRLLFAIRQLFPKLGDKLLRRFSK